MPSRILRLWNPDAGGPGVGAWEEVGDSRLTAHLGAADPHPAYLTPSEADARYLQTGQGGISQGDADTRYVNVAGDTMTGDLTLQGATASTNILRLRAAADSNPRLMVDASGKMLWGPGGASPLDVELRRFSATELVTNATLLTSDTTRDIGRSATRWRKLWAAEADLSGPLTVAGDVTLSEATPTVALKQAADTQPRSRLTDTALAFGPGGSTAPDTTLSRTGAGALRVDTDLGVAVNPAAWASGFAGLQVGQGASLFAAAENTGAAQLLNNSFYDGAYKAIANAPATRFTFDNNAWAWANAPAVAAGAAQTFTTRLTLDPNGTLGLTPDAGAAALAVPWGTLQAGAGGNLQVRAGTNLELEAPSGTVAPARDNVVGFGWSGGRWSVLYAANGTIQTSSREAKEGITPLDPAQALQAVRSTPAVTFTYKAPEKPPEYYDLPDDPLEAQAVLEQRMRAAPLEEAARTQAGFVAEDAHALMLTGEGQTNPSNTCGVFLACLQELDRRLTALEGAS